MRGVALASNEIIEQGFVLDRDTRKLAVTLSKTGAKYERGFLRDLDGRLVVVRG